MESCYVNIFYFIYWATGLTTLADALVLFQFYKVTSSRSIGVVSDMLIRRQSSRLPHKGGRAIDLLRSIDEVQYAILSNMANYDNWARMEMDTS